MLDAGHSVVNIFSSIFSNVHFLNLKVPKTFYIINIIFTIATTYNMITNRPGDIGCGTLNK